MASKTNGRRENDRTNHWYAPFDKHSLIISADPALVYAMLPLG